ncbi:MAG: DUF3429 domain-containing protein [Rickettsiales bacterium]|nr:DUF3429 domain-containing protein [Rickettsiales bacterium]
MKIDSKLHQLLTYAGALPFLACAALLFMGISVVPLIGETRLIAQSYGLLILSFLCGIHWGTYLYKAPSSPLNLFISSNVIVIGVWVLSLVAMPRISLLGSAIGFALIILIEWKLYKADLISRAYFKMRRNVSFVVITCLLITALHGV